MSYKNEFEERKKILNEHLKKFEQLKKKERWEEAWKQLVVTLEYATDTLKFLNEQMSQFYRKVNKDIGKENKPKQDIKIIIKNVPKHIQ